MLLSWGRHSRNCSERRVDIQPLLEAGGCAAPATCVLCGTKPALVWSDDFDAGRAQGRCKEFPRIPAVSEAMKRQNNGLQGVCCGINS